MPGKYSSVTLFGALVAIVMAASTAEDGAAPARRTSRMPASIQTKKEPLVTSEFRHSYTEKIHGPLEVRIELDGAPPSKAGSTFVLKGIVRSQQDLNAVDFKWALPAGLTLIRGDLSGKLIHLSAEQGQEIEIVVQTQNGADHQVSLMAGSTQDDSRFADSVEFSVLSESVRAADLQMMKKAALKTERDGRPRQLKILH